MQLIKYTEVKKVKEKINAFDYSEKIAKSLRKGILLNSRDEKFNSMVIGWGHLGVIWGEPTFVAYVRDSRYTKAPIDKTGVFTVSIPEGEPDPHINAVCGGMSGRDVDKAAEAHLTLEEPEENGVPGIKEYPITLECKVLYSQKQDLSQIPDYVKEKFYKPTEEYGPDIHTAYIGKIVSAYIIK